MRGPRCESATNLGQCILVEGHSSAHRALPESAAEMVDPGAVTQLAEPSIATQLADWWRMKAESEIGQTVAKATEYSGLQGGLPLDMVDLGRAWVLASNRSTSDYTDAQLAEVGIWSYLVGKLGRWSSALRNGRMVSDDTLLDIAVYSRMASRIREAGQWP
jgi:hypothetical protein